MLASGELSGEEAFELPGEFGHQTVHVLVEGGPANQAVPAAADQQIPATEPALEIKTAGVFYRARRPQLSVSACSYRYNG